VNRRSFLATAGVAGVGGAAGCLDFALQKRSIRTPPLVEDRPDAVYYPTHVEGMKTVGTASGGGYECALTYTYPHRFWLVMGTRTKKVTIEDSDSVHLMPIVWDADTGIVPPDLNPQLRVTRTDDGETVLQRAPWPMLSQPMGFHFGDNVALGGEGTFAVEASLGEPSIRRTGGLADNEGQETFAFEFAFERSALEEITYRDIPETKQGTTGALPPIEMPNLPGTRLPPPGDLPGIIRGTATSGDATFVVATLGDATRFGGESETYLAVSPRTPYNRYPLPLLSLSGALVRDGETVFEGPLPATLDPELGHHYGVALPGVESGDALILTVGAPPQAARHEGYETAFVEMPEMELTL